MCQALTPERPSQRSVCSYFQSPSPLRMLSCHHPSKVSLLKRPLPSQQSPHPDSQACGHTLRQQIEDKLKAHKRISTQSKENSSFLKIRTGIPPSSHRKALFTQSHQPYSRSIINKEQYKLNENKEEGFESRQIKAVQNKQRRLGLLRDNEQRKAMQECTFKPKLTKYPL